MYTLYIANKNYSSWSLRPWLLMSVLEIPFEEHLLRLQPNSDGATFRDHTPSGKVPCLVDGDTAVWDSLSIVEYLAERHPGAWPEDRASRAWARSSTAEMHSGFATLRQACPMNCGITVRLHSIPPALRRDIMRIDSLWNEGFSRFGGPFLAGKGFSAVDAFFAPIAVRVMGYGLELSEPAMAYVQRVLALPAMRRWEAAALKEDFREHGHDREALANGTLVEDRRTPER